MLCEYGCGQEAKFPPGKGRRKWCCSEYVSQCPEVRRKNSESHKNPSEEIRKRMSEGHKGQIPWNKGKKGVQVSWNKGRTGVYSEEALRKNSDSNKGKIPWNKRRTGVYSEETLKEMSKIKRKSWEDPNSGLNSDSRSKKLSDKMKELWEDPNSVFNSDLRGKKIRIAAIKRIEDRYGQAVPNYNPDACKLIDEYGDNNNYNFQHAENGGEYHIKELGYWVDGYDKDKNVVIEIDESSHFDYKGDLKEKDIQRQKEIEKYLNCEFIRIKI